MQKIYQFHQGFFGFVLSGHVGKAFTCLGLNIYLGIAFAKAHGVAAAQLIAHVAHKQLAQGKKDHDRQDPVHKEISERGIFLRNDLRKFDFALH